MIVQLSRCPLRDAVNREKCVKLAFLYVGFMGDNLMKLNNDSLTR